MELPYPGRRKSTGISAKMLACGKFGNRVWILSSWPLPIAWYRIARKWQKANHGTIRGEQG
jgi:hypothetical protein